MATISIEGMEFYACHGVYEAERLVGGLFVVDVYIQTADMPKDDKVETAINYESIFMICQREMEQPRNLIETVLQSIIAKLKQQFGNMQGLRVRVAKMRPPVGGVVKCAAVIEEISFVKECPRCRKKFSCYGDNSCLCKGVQLHAATKETIVRQYNTPCLCMDCLKFYAN